MYKLTITKIEPLTEEEIKARAHRLSGGYPLNEYQQANLMKEKETRTVEVELTDSEYHSVRQSLIDFWDRDLT